MRRQLWNSHAASNDGTIVQLAGQMSGIQFDKDLVAVHPAMEYDDDVAVAQPEVAGPSDWQTQTEKKHKSKGRDREKERDAGKKAKHGHRSGHKR